MTAKVKFLDPDELEFSQTQGGIISLRKGRKKYPRVHAYRTFPKTKEFSYISLRDNEGNEIGIIESVKILPPEVQALLSEELETRYFTPTVRKIRSLREEYGWAYFDVDTDAGRFNFTVRVTFTAKMHSESKKLLMTDVHGNRFLIEDYTAADPKHLRILEILL